MRQAGLGKGLAQPSGSHVGHTASLPEHEGEFAPWGLGAAGLEAGEAGPADSLHRNLPSAWRLLTGWRNARFTSGLIAE